jgi:WD40 repeat protein
MTAPGKHPWRLRSARAAAGILYGALAVVVWWLMPVLPRATLPVGTEVLSLSPHGRLLATLKMGRVTLWDVATGRAAGELPGNLAGFKLFTFSPDGGWLGASRQGLWKLWEVPTGREVFAVSGWDINELHPDTTFSPDSKWLILRGRAPDDSSYVKVLDLEQERERPMLPQMLGQPPLFSPNGKKVACECADVNSEYYIRLWDWKTGKEIMTLEDNPAPHRQLAFSDDGKPLVAAEGWRFAWEGPYEVKWWDVATGKLRGSWKLAQPVGNLYFTGDGSQLLVVTYKHENWNATSRPPFGTLTVINPASPCPNEVGHIPLVSSLSPDGPILASVQVFSDFVRPNYVEHPPAILEVPAMRVRARLTPIPHGHWLKSCGFVPGGKLFAVESTPSSRLDPPPLNRTLTWLAGLLGFDMPAPSVSAPSELHFYDTGTGRRQGSVPIVTSPRVWFGADGRTLVVTAPDGTPALWTGVPTIWDLPLRKPWGRILVCWVLLAAFFGAVAFWLHRGKKKDASPDVSPGPAAPQTASLTAGPSGG